VKRKALGTGSAHTWPAPPPEPEAPPSRETVTRVVVAERDGKGIPTRLGLPAPLADRQVGLYVHSPRGRLWAGAVNADGSITKDLRDGATPDAHELAKVKPGSKIIGALDKNGRLLVLVAQSSKRRW